MALSSRMLPDKADQGAATVLAMWLNFDAAPRSVMLYRPVAMSTDVTFACSSGFSPLRAAPAVPG